MHQYFVLSIILVILACIIYRWSHKLDYGTCRSESHFGIHLGSGEMFDCIAPFYDVANWAMSLGLDKSWRYKLVKMSNLQDNESIVDLATGTGDVAIAMANFIIKEKIQKCQILGVDPSTKMLQFAQDKIEKSNLKSLIDLSLGDGQNLSNIRSQSVDLVTMSFGIRNVRNHSAAIEEIKRILKPSGRVLIMEFVNPRKGLLSPVISFFISTIVPMIGSMFSGGHEREYRHLGASIMNFPTPEKFLDIMKRSGFQESDCSAVDIFLDSIYIFRCKLD